MGILPKSWLIKLTTYLFAGLVLTLFLILSGNFFNPQYVLGFSNFLPAFKIATAASFISIFIIVGIGKFGWKLLWNFPGLKNYMNNKICPDLNGIWVGEIKSNYIDNTNEPFVKKVTMNIKADLFGFEISLSSMDDYQNSKVIQAEIHKDLRTNTFYLSYIFEANVISPLESDDRNFHGAAHLEIKLENDIKIEGLYWTNRASQRKLNTTGLIKLSRKK